MVPAIWFENSVIATFVPRAVVAKRCSASSRSDASHHREAMLRIIAAGVGVAHADLRYGEKSRTFRWPVLRHRQLLQLHQFGDAFFGERHEGQEIRLAERRRFSRALDLDDAA